ncbi:MAG: dihydropteroate synthase, partial [Planctomycetota bacterium]
MTWQVAPGRTLGLQEPRLMGVLNVTPDSFSDGGAYQDPAAAVEHGLCMVNQGACIVDVGGESVRPGALRVAH